MFNVAVRFPFLPWVSSAKAPGFFVLSGSLSEFAALIKSKMKVGLVLIRYFYF
jgi:hypothetical protein